MANYLDNYFQKQTELYNAILQKAIDGKDLTTNDLAFIKGYKTDLKHFLGKSPIQSIFDGIKAFQGLVIDNDNETEDIDNGI